MSTEWRDIPNYKGIYAISDTGEVKRLHREYTDTIGRKYVVEEMMLKSTEFQGEQWYRLSKNNKKKSYSIDQLLDAAFNNKPIRHKLTEDKSRLLPELVKQIRNYYDDNIPKLVKEFNVPYTTVYNIVNGITYKDEKYW